MKHRKFKPYRDKTYAWLGEPTWKDCWSPYRNMQESNWYYENHVSIV